jgi:hypothetical protein
LGLGAAAGPEKGRGRTHNGIVRMGFPGLGFPAWDRLAGYELSGFHSGNGGLKWEKLGKACGMNGLRG